MWLVTEYKKYQTKWIFYFYWKILSWNTGFVSAAMTAQSRIKFCILKPFSWSCFHFFYVKVPVIANFCETFHQFTWMSKYTVALVLYITPTKFCFQFGSIKDMYPHLFPISTCHSLNWSWRVGNDNNDRWSCKIEQWKD